MGGKYLLAKSFLIISQVSHPASQKPPIHWKEGSGENGKIKVITHEEC